MELFKDAIASIPETMPPLTIPLGKTGKSYTFVDLAKAPHMLYAGTTGSGKSVGLNGAISTIALRAGGRVRFHMIDPKRVELSDYADMACVADVVTDMDEAAALVDALVAEMDERYELMMDAGVKKLDDYNAKAKTPLPYEILVVDELGDLMDTHSKAVLPQLIRLGQLARAAGIHMLLATQRPAADTVPKRLLANVPTRVAYRCQSHTESRLVIGEKGAETLRGNGDLMAIVPGEPSVVRAQAPYISEDEVREVARVAEGPAGAPITEAEDDDLEVSELSYDEEDEAPAAPTAGVPDVQALVEEIVRKSVSVSADELAARDAEMDHMAAMLDERVRHYEARIAELQEANERMTEKLAVARLERDEARENLIRADEQARIALRYAERDQATGPKPSVKIGQGLLVALTLVLAVALVVSGHVLGAAATAFCGLGAAGIMAATEARIRTSKKENDDEADYQSAGAGVDR